ncbi:DegV family protein [Mesoplasma lactucae]|uniref:6-phosphogluconate dehydratase n=1 Tax=Mesoplasma lactucae ATCC 49193 TaxID=81460 RepID=A0A291IS55_9MOLU|nr:DegV family protein [Mesoplasma lactucae]ATG97568.1 6-phosphogluconate dehydratase [Mesoplasma lactucae ATCC 49193]ATZ19973.1 fatty acid-binding protein DegV [Mesoplasma lactucae ATCC 49193]MCL8217076.1 Fatty acid-binding protein [Mesoplasma lactucae ATCC 49193]
MENKKIGILVDTAGGNDPSVYENTNVDLIPLHIVFEDGTDVKDTEANLKTTNFYQRVSDGENVKTSQASPGELAEKYDEMLNKYDHIIHLPIPQNLSSMYQTSLMMANDGDYDEKITVVEHSMAANGIKECALAINKKLQAEEFKSIDEVLAFIKDYEKNMYLGIIPGDLKKLAKGGRALNVLNAMLSLFKTKVLIKWEAKPKKQAMARTIGALVKPVIETTKKDYKNPSDYKFIFVSTPLTDEKIKDNAKEALDAAKIKYTEELIPPLYTAHAGVNTIGFVTVKIYK